MQRRWLIFFLGLGTGIICRGQGTPPPSGAPGTVPTKGTQVTPPTSGAQATPATSGAQATPPNLAGPGARQGAPPELVKIKAAAEAGDPAAQFAYGNVIPLSRLAEQLDWYHRSARAGYAPAQNALGGYYASLSGNPKKRAESVRESIRWSSRAAYQDVQDSQYRIAGFYESGEGLPKDRIYAYVWRRMATRNNAPDKNVDDALKRLITEMSSTEIAEAESRLKTFELKFTSTLNPVEADMLFGQLQLGATYLVNGVRQIVLNGLRFKQGDIKELKLAEESVRIMCLRLDEGIILVGIDGTPYTRRLKR